MRSYDPLDFVPPEPAVISTLLAPQRLYHRPTFFGLEHVPRDRPTLYVGNHTIFGVMDAPLIIERLYRESGRLPRALADHAHYQLPGWRDMLHWFGVVDGTRDNCAALMRAGESVLVFPGGGREVAKRKGEDYALIWKQRLGFVRMAVQHGYSITPFASVGPEQCYSIRLDANDLGALPIWKWLERTPLSGPLRGGDLVMPIATGLLGSPLPRPEPFFIGLDAPIETSELCGRADDNELLFALRRTVRERIEGLLDKLRVEQARARVQRSRARRDRLTRTLEKLGVQARESAHGGPHPARTL